jgi:hypothetical protein
VFVPLREELQYVFCEANNLIDKVGEWRWQFGLLDVAMCVCVECGGVLAEGPWLLVSVLACWCCDVCLLDCLGVGGTVWLVGAMSGLYIAKTPLEKTRQTSNYMLYSCSLSKFLGKAKALPTSSYNFF